MERPDSSELGGDEREIEAAILQAVGFYRKFCANFSEITAPLFDLLSPRKKFQWDDACQRAFERVKSVLTSFPVLRAPEFEKPFKLAVDASDVGVGSVLLQEDECEIEHPVSFFS